ncbi:MAG: CpsD/CapB family tyrosine-protein kinase [Bryobacteraceae bacterium]|nr:CpsD/CapB family tyrosine-protein kinase [Bryobacteraceae bacterium]MCX7603263.1 CpsD/CapB family tyrosine-protein kinase [Bryobacteraceae bacterium]
MSRVHDALRKAQISGAAPGTQPGAALPPAEPAARSVDAPSTALTDLLSKIQTVPFSPAPDASLLDPSRPGEAPAEEFRSLRTRLNHIQSLQPIHSLVITSPSPAEGKSFTAANLAIAQAQLEGNFTLLADFDFRRPVIHTLFQQPRSPGITDYLQGKVPLEAIIKRLEGTNLFIMTAGEAVLNPLELLNLPEAKQLIEELPALFNWVIIDTPPLLFAADANLLSTMAHALLMVVRIGTTTIDSVTRAIGSLCQNNILGIVVNAAQKSELYSKYTYYHSYYAAQDS